MNRLIPLACNVSRSQVEDFFESCFCLEDLSGFRNLTDLPVESFDGIGGVDEPAKIVAVDEVRGKLRPVLLPASDRDGVSFSPSGFKS